MSADLGGVLSAATEYGDQREAEACASRQAEVDAMVTQRNDLLTKLVNAERERDTLRAELAAHMATHQPDPTPQPEPPTTAAPLLGMSAPADVWGQRKREVEATGGKLQARRIFLGSLGAGLSLVQAAHREGLLPVVSFKVGDWGDVAAGQSDNALRTLADRLAALGKPVVIALHHEPDQKATPADIGEGGTAQEFAAMQARALPILKSAPNVQVAVIMNGWWWDEKGGFTDAEIEAWLPAHLRKQLDVIAADDYSPAGGRPSVVKTRGRVEWAKRVGHVKATGVGEFNGFVPSDLADLIAYAKTEPLFRGGWLLVWNSAGDSYLPLTETGLLDDFQALLKSWPT